MSVHYFPYTEHTSSTKLRKVVDLLEAEHDLRVEMRRFAELLGDRAYHEAVVAAKAEDPVEGAEAEAS